MAMLGQKEALMPKRAGQPLADGLFGVLWSLKGDLDYFSKTLKLRHYNSNHMCDLCTAGRVGGRELLYNNFDADALWKQQLLTPQQWRACYNARFLHYIFNLAGVTNLCLEPDELHVIHLGVSQYTLGTILFLLVFKVLPDSPEDNMKVVWKEVCSIYSKEAVGCQFNNITISSFCNAEKPNEHWPRLKGKGAELKDFVPVAKVLWQKWAPTGERTSALVSQLLGDLDHSLDILKANSKDMFLPVDEAKDFQKHIDRFLLTYQHLASNAEAEGSLLWNNPTKFHHLWHLSQKAMFLNPRRTNTFIDEDFVGRMKTLVHACAAGTELHHMSAKAADKYRWGLHFLAK